MDIQWYPGHMAKAKREIGEYLKQVDLVVELVDARAPADSRNPDLKSLHRKPTVVAVTKADLADPQATNMWLAFWCEQNDACAVLDLQTGTGLRELFTAMHSRLSSRRRAARALVAGIPNVGKSTLINRLAGANRAKTGAKPGVTRGRQWIKARGMQFLDTPGVLWPKFDDQETAIRLALIAAIRDDIYDQEETAQWLLNHLQEHYPAVLSSRYGKNEDTHWLETIALRRGLLKSGGVPDTERAAKALVQDFRLGRLGRISLQWPKR